MAIRKTSDIKVHLKDWRLFVQFMKGGSPSVSSIIMKGELLLGPACGVMWWVNDKKMGKFSICQ